MLTTNARRLPIIPYSIMAGLLLPSLAQADPWWAEKPASVCAQVQIGTGLEPEKDTVGLSCRIGDAVYSSLTDESGGKLDDGWVIAPVGSITGNDEQDTIGYVRRPQ